MSEKNEPLPEEIRVGDRVIIRSVAYPNHPSHAMFVGVEGTVEKVFKTRDGVVVQTALGKRECELHRVKRVEVSTKEGD